jgi:AraC-like DNA-binding protein
MIARQSLYESATGRTVPDALLHVGSSHTCYVGTLDYVKTHRHGAVVFLAGLYGTFQLRVDGGEWLTCRTAVIPAGVRHELHLHGEPLGVYYPEPDVALQSALLRLVQHRDVHAGIILGRGQAVTPLRELYEHRASHLWVGEALAELTSRTAAHAAPIEIDPRLAAVIAHLREFPDDLTPVDRLAGVHNLSGSRFLHLFSEQLGVPYRRYRIWNRVRAAMRCALAGNSLTDAALATGFADSAHFTHNFRDTFGVTPTYVFNRIARVG